MKMRQERGEGLGRAACGLAVGDALSRQQGKVMASLKTDGNFLFWGWGGRGKGCRLLRSNPSVANNATAGGTGEHTRMPSDAENTSIAVIALILITCAGNASTFLQFLSDCLCPILTFVVDLNTYLVHQVYAHPEYYGGRCSVIPVPQPVVDAFRDSIPRSRADALSWVPAEFNTLACQVYELLGSPICSADTAWDLFSKMGSVMR
ncbi:hypothetical protein C8R45DRAFT_941027 [Mycena sanguinolenta]|nr:hypothetical protein C8R45DRAFT_941027 [Mycena sanguinolenta]